MKPVNILIADSNYLVRQGLRGIFESVSEYKVVFETDTFSNLFEDVKKYNADVVVIGLNTRGESPKDMIHTLLVRFPQKKVLVIDMLEDRNEIVQILQLGVHGYILKECDKGEILDALRTILSNKNFFCSNVIKFNRDRDGINSKLSVREVEILKLIAEGMTNNEIAEKIYLSSHTVATHRKNLMRKLNAKNNVDLVISAIKESIIIP